MESQDIYRIKATYTAWVWVDVEADDKEEAMEQFNKEVKFQPDAIIHHNSDLERSVDWVTDEVECEYLTTNYEEDWDDYSLDLSKRDAEDNI
jgi:hypothetical protein